MTDQNVELDQISPDGEPPEFDLTPQKSAGSHGGRMPRNRKWFALVVLLALVGAGAFLLSNLGGATEYFHRVDEAVAMRSQLGTQRFRIQGTVVTPPKGRSIENNKQRISFVIEANGVTAPVVYTGSDPPALFKRCEPVLIVGNWSADAQNEAFLGDQIIIKHDENYSADHKDRLQTTSKCN